MFNDADIYVLDVNDGIIKFMQYMDKWKMKDKLTEIYDS